MLVAALDTGFEVRQSGRPLNTPRVVSTEGRATQVRRVCLDGLEPLDTGKVQQQKVLWPWNGLRTRRQRRFQCPREVPGPQLETQTHKCLGMYPS